jgi:uncharacterized membrane protein YbhN (UPF0104 family)
VTGPWITQLEQSIPSEENPIDETHDGPDGPHGEESLIEETSDELAAHSRTLRNSVISLAVFFGLVVGLLLSVPGLHSVEQQISHADSWWVAAAVGLEVLSCTAYVVLFGLVFGMLGKRLVSRLSLSELAVNSVVSVSGLAGLALGAWVLRVKGISVERIAKRSVLIFVLTSAVNVGAVVVIGVPMWLGLLPGSRNPLLTLLPAAAGLASILGTLTLASWARRAAARRPLQQGRWAVTLVALSGGVKDAVRLIREHDWRVLGAVGYWLFDNLALYACLAAFGATPGVWVVMMAYLVGMLANALPIPGGLVAVEGGLVGMLVLFDVRPASVAVAAVLIYRAVSLWIPALIGSLAFLSLRREIGKPLKPEVVGVAGP